jgi:serpin B
MAMLTRRDTLRILGITGLVAPALTACGGGDGSGSATDATDPAGMRLVSADAARSAGDAQAIPDVVSAIGAFTSDLWGHLAPADQNLALSPYSIAVALAMTANGAAGATQSQMLDVLRIGSLATYNGGTAALTRSLEALAGQVDLADGKKGEIDLASADQLFGDAATEFGRAFLTVLAKEYDAGMRTVDFRHDADGARTLINGWTAQQTHDRIPTILPLGSVDQTTRLVLVNALYFKAPWLTPFEKVSTRPRAFHRADGSRVEVPMMRATPNGARYVSGPHWRGARLLYAGSTLAMTVALPDHGHEPDAVKALLGGALTAEGQPGVEVSLPRWTFRTPTGLRQILMDLGITQAFGDRADFAPMSPDDPLYVDDVQHQAFVAVDEAGTEAAAATAVVMDELSASVGGNTLVLDRPFLFVIHDTAHGTPLFVGRVADPS